MDDRESSRVVGRESCPECGSADNVARYEDGGAHCFTPGCGYHEHPGDGQEAATPRQRGPVDFLTGEVRELRSRRLHAATCAKYDYRVGDHKDQKVQVATYWRDGAAVFQKVRTADKAFWTKGDDKTCGLYGQHLFPDGGRRVVVTEGEIDALSVAQAFQLKWPVVSVPGGAGNAEAAIRRELRWLEGYDEVVLWFDNDDPGRAAAEACARLFTPGKAKVAFASGAHKDASDMLVAGEEGGILRAVYDARVWRPEGIVSLSDVKAMALRPVERGAAWPWEGVTKATYGRRDGEVIALGAGTGVGKTDFFTQTIMHDMTVLKRKCGVLYLEQPVVETAKRIAGKHAGRRFHVPDAGWTNEELAGSIEAIEQSGGLQMFDAFGATSWDVVGPALRYMVVGLGCKHVFLDHLTALAAAEEDERTALERIMAELAGIAKETGCVLHFVSHLATPEGKPHEEGGRVMIRHFKGSRAIGFWSHFMFGLERDQQASDPEKRGTTTLRCLKDRYTGNATGMTWGMRYDQDTGMLEQDDTGMPTGPGPVGGRHGDF